MVPLKALPEPVVSTETDLVAVEPSVPPLKALAKTLKEPDASACAGFLRAWDKAGEEGQSGLRE